MNEHKSNEGKLMSHEQIDIRQGLEQELNETIKEFSGKAIHDHSLREGQSLKHAFEEFIELTSIITAKAHEQHLTDYGDTVKVTGLALSHLLRQEITLNTIATAFAVWSHRKRMVVTGWSLEGLAKVGDGETNPIELGNMMDKLSSAQKITFLGLHHAYYFCTEMMTDESFDLTAAQNNWLEVLSKVQANAIKVLYIRGFLDA